LVGLWLDVSLLLAFARRAKPVLAKRFKKQKALSCVAARLQRVFACGLASLRQLYAAARRESHPDVDRRACWSLSGRPPAAQFFFSRLFSQKRMVCRRCLRVTPWGVRDRLSQISGTRWCAKTQM